MSVTTVGYRSTDATMSADPGNSKQPVYKFNGKTYKSFAECFAAAQAAENHGRAAFWDRLQVVEVEGRNGEQLVKLRCCLCLDDYSASNISQFAGSHFLDGYTTCVKSAGSSSSVKRTAAAAGAVTQDAPKRNKGDITTFFVPRKVADEALDHLARFFFTNATVALQLIEDEHLVASYASMGVELPGKTE